MKQGFSLVELSIVLVILGLLVGGVLSGQSLIRAAELRSLTTDYTKYLTAVRSFRDKYFALPGDMTNATAFWGSLGGTGADATCQNTVATGTPTCNGDGDGSLYNVTNGPNGSWESARFWQHLANAGLVEGHYTGVNTTNLPGVNVPLSKIANTFLGAAMTQQWALGTGQTYFAGSTLYFAGDLGKDYFRVLSTTASSTVAGSFPLKPEEAWNIDTKFDDGLPATGMIVSNKGDGTNTNCTTFAGIAPPGDDGAKYLLTNPSKDCSFIFIKDF